MIQTVQSEQTQTSSAPFAHARFEDVVIVPVTSDHQRIPHGGPIWPDFDQQTFVRQCRKGVPVDRAAKLPEQVTAVREEGVWGGYLDPHFGHFMAEHVSRLPIARKNWPDKALFFTVPEGTDETQVPQYLWDILTWYGIDHTLIEVVTHPLRVGTLYACEQGEALPRMGGSAAYLDLMDEITSAHALPVPNNSVVYVSRQGMASKGKGAHLGESYVVQTLQDLGVTILNPAEASFAEQMETYATASTLIFAEGSALHGRQALGRIKQDVHVLNRRQGRRVAQAFIEPRVTALTYHPTAACELKSYFGNGQERPATAAAIYDLDALFGLFDALSVPLEPVWNQDSYRAAVCTDAAQWLQTQDLSSDELMDNFERLSAAGFDLTDVPLDLLPDALDDEDDDLVMGEF